MTNKEEIIGRLALSVQNYKRADAAAAAKEALDAGIDPLEAINDGLLKGMTLVGDLFSKHKARSEERRVGKECRSRWSPYH